jgi:hypothetical protein
MGEKVRRKEMGGDKMKEANRNQEIHRWKQSTLTQCYTVPVR